jgi:U-box domain
VCVGQDGGEQHPPKLEKQDFIPYFKLRAELQVSKPKTTKMTSIFQKFQSSYLESGSICIRSNPPKTSDSREESRKSVPDEFICPITLEMIRYPMKTIYGHVFERQAIYQWLEQDYARNGQSRCPLTRRPLSISTDVQPHYELLRRIKQYQVENMQENYQDHLSDYMNRLQERLPTEAFTTSSSPCCVWSQEQMERLDRVMDEYDQFINRFDSIEVLAQ